MALSQTQNLNKVVKINSEVSYIEINGTTNVNSFNCGYNAKLPSNTFEVSVTKKANDFTIEHEALFLKVKDFKCSNSQMTYDFHELLEYQTYPYIIFQLQKVSSGNTAHIMIEMAGQKQSYSVKIDTERNNNKLVCNAKMDLCITDFGLEAPEKFFGMVKVNENIEVEFRIELNIYDN
jgi:hypothetical protein